MGLTELRGEEQEVPSGHGAAVPLPKREPSCPESGGALPVLGVSPGPRAFGPRHTPPSGDPAVWGSRMWRPIQCVSSSHGFQIRKCTYFLSCFPSPKHSPQGAVRVPRGHVRSRGNRRCLTCIPSWGHTRRLPAFSALVLHASTVHGLPRASPPFFFCMFVPSVISLFEIPPPSTVLECCLASRSAGRLRCALWRKCLCRAGFLQAWVRMLVVQSSVIVSQQYVFQKTCLGAPGRLRQLNT